MKEIELTEGQKSRLIDQIGRYYELEMVEITGCTEYPDMEYPYRLFFDSGEYFDCKTLMFEDCDDINDFYIQDLEQV